MESRSPDVIAALRALEAMREIGVLLIAFAPLDFAVSGEPVRSSWPYLLGFFLAGLLLLIAGISGERRLHDG
jgi:hypothetical protein